MSLNAQVKKKTLSIDTLAYRETKGDKAYTACFYELKANVTENALATMSLDPKKGVKIHLELKHNDGMNVYLYGGKNRKTAIHSIIPDNE